jgi:nucleotide-binding universal stress UspA family protein
VKIIFVPVADRPECARALRSAFEIAKKLGASVIGCHMRPHKYSEVSLSRHFSEEILGDNARALHAEWQKKSSGRSSNAARALYGSIAETSGFPVSKRLRNIPVAMWQLKVGSPDKLLAISGPVSDLLVVSRPTFGGGKVAGLFMLAALMESSKPVLILPQSGRAKVGERVCIAWNQSAEAARAVSAAMPILQTAKQVNIVSCGPENRIGPKAKQLADYLAAWGVRADRHSTRGQDVDKELIAGYRKTNSDLLVMGAYSRNRWREVVFGGTSYYMLRHANIPVLMLHT